MTHAETDGEDLLHHLLVDLLWKIGIIAALALISIIAAVILYKRVR